MSEIPITGQVLPVYPRRPRTKEGQETLVLRDPELRTVAGRPFVCDVLYYPDAVDAWYHGRRIRIALDDVGHYYEFDTVEEYLEIHPRKKGKLVSGR